MPFGPVDSQLDLVALEQRALARWRGIALSEQVSHLREGATPWVFYEGPPTTNGRPGLHHVWARAFKDLFPRFQTMRGHDVPRKGGWDCHGLPVEIEVEKQLGFTRKSEIEAYGVGNFNDRCRESVQRYVEDWDALTERAAVWIDTKNAYWTLSNEYIESVWWLVRQLFDAGLLYEGHRVSPYCPRCGTALSSHELGQPGAYRDVTDPSVYVRFPVVGRDVDLLMWTTTPWTLVSNVAAAVGADISYVRVAPTAFGDAGEGGGGRDLVMAASRAPDDATVVERWQGSELVGWRYERPFTFLPLDDRGARVVAAGFVSTDDGSGIVHLAPAFGADDMDVAKAEGLPVLNPVDADGTFDATVPPWHGVGVRDANPYVIEELVERGLLVRQEAYQHSYPHCWRCGTPLLYWAKTSWFVRTSERKADLLRENERVDWHPAHIKHGRFGDWLENNVDWALSRDRYWGTPLPIWRCDGGHDTCIGSVAELEELSGSDLSALDLHRPYIDGVAFLCRVDDCSEIARRLAPVLDAWFDSGSMPSAQHHHPFGEPGTFESSFPADFICEAIDQTRGWFYSLLAVNTLVFGSTPYRNVVCLAHIVDQHGQKMSKSKGNVLDPWQVFDTQGADALRWYFFSAGSPWTSRRVYEDGIREATRKTLLTFWNVYSFFATYADIDGWEPEGEAQAPAGHVAPAVPAGHVMDRWVLGRLDETVASVTTSLDGFDALAAANAIAGFVDDLSNWYVRRSRPRFWGGGPERPPERAAQPERLPERAAQPERLPERAAQPDAAHGVLHRCLVVTAQLLAPFCPFLADEVYVSLTGDESVHLSDWPAPAGAPPVSGMDAARRLVGLGRSARTDAGLGVRQPLRRALLLHPGVELDDDIRAEIRDELNVKALEDVESLTDLLSWTVVPNFRALGPRLGPKVNEVKAALAAADGAALRRALEADGFVEVAGHRLGPADVEVRAGSHDDYALSSDEGWAVALDLELDESLEREGVARQLARELNDLRKRLQLALTDRVRIGVEAGPRVAAAVEAHRDWITGQVLAVELAVVADAGPGAAGLEVAGEPVRVELAVAP